MDFYCNSMDVSENISNIHMSYNSLTAASLRNKNYHTIITVDTEAIFGGHYFSLISDADTTPNMKIVVPLKSSHLDYIKSVRGTRLYDIIYKIYDKHIPFKVITIKDMLIDVLVKSFGEKYNLEYFTPRTSYTSSKYELFLEYSKYIKDSPTNATYKFISGQIPFLSLNSQNIKDYFRLYFAECLKIVQVTNTEEFEKYVTLQKFFKDILNPSSVRTAVKYKSIIHLMECIKTTNAFDDLKKFFQNESLSKKGTELVEKFKNIQKLCNFKSVNKIPDKILNLNIYKDKIKYEFYGSSFLINCNLEHASSIPTNLIQFVNIIINLGKFESIKNECEKIILLNC